MGLLVSFFVMLIRFPPELHESQNRRRFQRDAFGVQDPARYSGIIEVLGLPTRPKLKNAANIDPSEASATPTPDDDEKEAAMAPA